MLAVIHHRGRITTASNYAKFHHAEIAALASRGYITTRTPEGFGRSWRLTSEGAAHLEQQ